MIIDNPEIQQKLMSLDRLKQLMYLYQKRIATAKHGYFQKTDFEKNEVEILIHLTENKITELQAQIDKQSKSLQEYMYNNQPDAGY